ncbi:predicted protein [Naegleria gruberi]|uniref:Predicted protein n=1 Tax=Naegleria gruberi TaxID=5762 RepID=D2VR49_NAEGR|nr:uncharacterized protein NAEGRDRAFT_71461 [Naegleria gruberi]EFC40832.1 predicted protein [Naegleria gruberi]|eukprot:XP_002673576.1 predicted protein [Naegleria gruberi strain NEG-M]
MNSAYLNNDDHDQKDDDNHNRTSQFGMIDFEYTGMVEIEGKIGFLPQHFEEITKGDESTIITMLKFFPDADIQQFLEQPLQPLSEEWYNELNSIIGDEIYQQTKLIGLNNDLLEQPFESLSGGEKTKSILCALSIVKPDILLLDEPTNHLDVQGIEWLEHFLKDYDGAVVMVTHDRTLINSVSNRISELSPHTKKFVHFRGGYENYLAQEEKKRQRAMQERELQDKELKNLKQKSIQMASSMKARKLRDPKNRDKLSYNNQEERVHKGTSKAFNQITRKQEHLLENRTDLIQERNKISFEFDESSIASSLSIELSDLSKSFAQKPLFQNLSFTLVSGDRLIIQGPNGSGKTTLMNIIMGLTESDEGSVNISKHAKIGYLDQEQENMPLDKTAIELLMEDSSIQATKQKVITELCNLGVYTWHDLNSPLKSLSIGCRRKVQLCKIIMQKCSILVLDELTNHIDFPSLEVIEEALMNFPGIIIATSHDRYFTEKIATDIINLEDYSPLQGEDSTLE